MLLEGRQAGRNRTKISMMMIDRQFVVEGRRGRVISTNTPGRGHGRGGKLIIDIIGVN